MNENSNWHHTKPREPAVFFSFSVRLRALMKLLQRARLG